MAQYRETSGFTEQLMTNPQTGEQAWRRVSGSIPMATSTLSNINRDERSLRKTAKDAAGGDTTNYSGDPYRYTTNEDGVLRPQQRMTNPKNNQSEWRDINSIPKDRTMAGHKVGRRNAHMSNYNKKKAQDLARDVYSRGPGSLKRRDEAENMGGLEATWKHGANEFEDMAAGLGEAFRFWVDVNAPGGRGNEWAMRGSNKFAEDQAEKLRLNREFEESTGFSKIGKMGPYLATNQFVAPRIMSGMKTVGQGARQMVQSANSRAAQIVRNQARGRGAPLKDARDPRPAAQYLEKKVVDPLAARQSARQNRPPKESFWTKDLYARPASDLVLGVGEGTIMPGDTAVMGGVSSLLGGTVGRKQGYSLERNPSKLEGADRETVDWWDAEGYRIDPGMESGRVYAQKKHSQARTDDKYSGLINNVDIANEKVVANVAGRAAGIPKGGMQTLTKDYMNKHLKGLKSEYNQLEGATKGTIDPNELVLIDRAIRDRVRNLPDANKAEIVKLRDSVFRITRKSRGRGRIVKSIGSYNGEQFQDMRQQLVEARGNYSAKGEASMANAVKEMIEGLDTSMKRSMTDQLGPIDAARWVDLNERYAMSQILMRHGLSGGHVDMSKLSSHLMTTDPVRTVTGQGGRIRDFQRIADLQSLESRQVKQGFGADNIDGGGKKAPPLKLTDTSAVQRPSALQRARHWYYQEWKPEIRGRLNLPNQGLGSVGETYRAAEQAVGFNEIIPETYRENKPWVLDAHNRYKEKEDPIEGLMNMFNFSD